MFRGCIELLFQRGSIGIKLLDAQKFAVPFGTAAADFLLPDRKAALADEDFFAELRDGSGIDRGKAVPQARREAEVGRIFVPGVSPLQAAAVIFRFIRNPEPVLHIFAVI